MRAKVVQNRWIPFRGFTAITLMGIIFTRDKSLITPQVLNHERIHCRQQLEWLYIPFFILYLLEWVTNLLRHGSAMEAYRNITFEREAYSHEREMDYLTKRQPFANYRKRI